MKVTAIAILCMMLFISGCSLVKPTIKSTGSLAVTVAIPSASKSATSRGLDFPIGKVAATLTRASGTSPAPQEAIPVNGSVQFSFPALAPGTWTLKLEAFDTDNTLSHQSSTSVNINPSLTTNAAPILLPCNGTLKATVDVTNLIAAGYQVTMVKVFLNDYSYQDHPAKQSATQDPSGVWHISTSNLTPSTYSIRVAAYINDTPIWIKVMPVAQVHPGRESVIGSSSIVAQVSEIAGDGALSVGAAIAIRPDPPTGVSAMLTDGGVKVTWSPSPDLSSVAWQTLTTGAYFIYAGIKGTGAMGQVSGAGGVFEAMNSYVIPDIIPPYVSWRGHEIEIAVCAGYRPPQQFNYVYSKWSNIAEVVVPVS